MSSENNVLEGLTFNFFSKAGACIPKKPMRRVYQRRFWRANRACSTLRCMQYAVAAMNDTTIVQFREAEPPLNADILTAV